jgi:predicted GH43/DUF377 family glycosyl hydrolase
MWKKKGVIFNADNHYEWMKTHTSLPFADRICDNFYRIYFSTRDSNNRSSIGYLEIDIKNPKKILKLSDHPVLSIGNMGSFDDSGVMGSCIVNHKGKKYLYYIGWNLGVTVPFRWSIGLAISNDGGKTFVKYSNGPILDRNPIDPYLVSSPTVIFEDGTWKMWYISALRWEVYDGKLRAPYHIKYAESHDGINWRRTGMVAIDFKHTGEFAIGRASVIKENHVYKMWYSYSTGKYRIGYAESKDGLHWERKDDQAGIDVSKSGWDSEMIEHANVFIHNDRKYMLYTGNQYGKTGFGYAVLN